MKMLQKSYDFVIVGAGSSGCVLAKRLSQNKGVRVALIESGPNDQQNQAISTPGKWFKSNQQKPIFWENYQTEVEKFANSKRHVYQRSRILGGSSSTNAMIYSRASADNFEKWSQLLSKNGEFQWDMEKLYKKSENNNSIFANDSHGTQGELYVSSFRHPLEISQDFLNACKSAGHEQIEDFNNEDESEGVGYFQANIYGGMRCSASTAFLDEAVRSRPNFEILSDLTANKLNMIGSKVHSVQAVGHNGQHVRIEAEKEVILCAGALNSPKLLMLSGIGRRQDLEPLHIKCINDLQGVGQNLQDHPLLHLRCKIKQNKTPLNFSFSNLGHIMGINRQYKQSKSGVLSSNLQEIGVFLRKQNQILLNLTATLIGSNSFQYGNGFTVSATVLSPKSKGEVRIRDRDPRKSPIFSFNLLQEKEDVEAMKHACRQSFHILEQEPLKSQIADIQDKSLLENDEKLEQFIRNQCQLKTNATGSCRMGMDDMSVVDSQFKIHNIENLRVVDSSVIPFAISAENNIATCILLGEKAAEEINKKYLQN